MSKVLRAVVVAALTLASLGFSTGGADAGPVRERIAENRVERQEKRAKRWSARTGPVARIASAPAKATKAIVDSFASFRSRQSCSGPGCAR